MAETPEVVLMKRWLLLAALACGCAVVDSSATPARVFGVSASDGAITQDGTADAGETATDVLSVDVMMDVQGDRPSADVVTNDVLDGGSDATAPDVDVAPPTETGVDAGDGSVGPDNGPDATIDAPDVQPDRADVQGTDVIDAGSDGPDAQPDVPTDNGPDAPDVVTPDVPVDTGPEPCPIGQSRCGGVCVDTQRDNDHCGGCSRGCSLGAVCSGGACGSICSPSEQRCSDSCVDTRTSTAHCGGCDNACPTPANASAVCASSACGIGVCNTGFANCDGSVMNGCEIDTRTSRTNCGMCGRVCAFANAAASCVTSACVMGACNAGFGNCDSDATNGCETTVATSVTNCGACGNRCATGQSCVSGVCVCPSGQSVCGGACVNTQTDPNNCGTCGNVCPTQVCAAGACATTPIPPRVNIVWDPAMTETRGVSIVVVASHTNAVGLGGYVSSLAPGSRLCLAGSEAIMNGCRTNVRALTVPGDNLLIGTSPSPGWSDSRWGMFVRPLRADGSALCVRGDSTCGGRWNGSTFRGLTFRCANPGARIPVPPIAYMPAFGTSDDYVIFLDVTAASGPGTCEE